MSEKLTVVVEVVGERAKLRNLARNIDALATVVDARHEIWSFGMASPPEWDDTEDTILITEVADE